MNSLQIWAFSACSLLPRHHYDRRATPLYLSEPVRPQGPQEPTRGLPPQLRCWGPNCPGASPLLAQRPLQDGCGGPPPLTWVASRCEGGPSGSRVSGLSEAAEGRVGAGPQARLARSWEQSRGGCWGRAVPARARRSPQREVGQGSLK